MSAESFRRLILRDLEGFGRQLEAYPDASGIWSMPPGGGNAPGTLALHVAGNLRHFIGRELGGEDYLRDRPGEFSRTGLARSELLAELQAAAESVDGALRGMPADRLAEPFPQPVTGVQLTTGRFLAHLCTHLTYHLGQVDMHRRFTTGQGALEGLQDLVPLAD